MAAPQSKWYSRLASASSTLSAANPTPGQPLLPAPNGTNLKSCPSCCAKRQPPAAIAAGRRSPLGGRDDQA
uniref:Uncharacterized protein n=1 Tax=Oryza punctata TaxID=4537 RepID=A0A0E0JFV9_ORYPU